MESDLISWIVNGLVDLVLDLVTGCLNILTSVFSLTMGPKESGTLDLFFELFLPGAKGGAGTNPYEYMVAAGLIILYAIMLFQIFKGLFGPLAKAENPLKLVAKTILFGFLIVGAKDICNFMFTLVAEPYEFFADVNNFGGGTGDQIGAILSSAAAELGDEAGGLSGLAADVIVGILSITIMFSIMVNYYKLMIEIVERYIITGVLAFFSPLCIATGASENTDQIFKSWIKMMISQCLLMVMSVFFLSAFSGALGRVSNGNDVKTHFLQLLMLLAWLRTGQRIDSHMSSLGLTVAQAGGGLYSDMFAGAALQHAVGNAITNPGGTTAGKMINNGLAMKQAGGALAWGISNAGSRVLGEPVSRALRSVAGDKTKQKAAEYDARTNPFGAVRGDHAISGAAAKYGDTKIQGQNGEVGKSLNDLMNEGSKITGATMTENGAQVDMVDKDGNAFSLNFADTANGASAELSTDNEQVANNVLGLPDAGTDDAAAMAKNTDGVAGQNTDDQGQPTDASLGDQIAEGTMMTNEDGLEGAATQMADDSMAMEAEKAVATGEDGEQHDVSGLVNDDGTLTDAGQQALDENGNLIANDGAAIPMQDGQVAGGVSTSARDENMRTFAQGADGANHNLTGLVNADGSLTEAGKAATKDGALTAQDGSKFAVGADGKVAGVQSAAAVGNMVKGENGSMASIAGSIDKATGTVDKSKIQTDANGNQFITASDGSKVGVNADGSIGATAGGQGSFTAATGTFKTAGNGQGAGQATVGVTNGVMKNGGGIGVNAAGQATTATYNRSGNLALASNGQMANVSGYANADGTLTAKGQAAVSNGAVNLGNGVSVPLNSSGGINTFSQAAGASGAFAVGTGAPANNGTGGASMVAMGAGGQGTFNTAPAITGGMSISGGEISHGYQPSSSGNYIHTNSSSNGGYQQIYSGSGDGGPSGFKANGDVQMYNSVGEGESGASTFESMGGTAAGGVVVGSGADAQYYMPSDSGSYAMVAATDASGNSSFNMMGVTSSQRYGESASYGGLDLQPTSGGGYQIGFTADATAQIDGNGGINIDMGNGQSVRLTSCDKYDAPFEGAAQVSYGGQSYWAEPTSSAVSGSSFGGYSKAGQAGGYGAVAAGAAVRSIDDGASRNYFNNPVSVGASDNYVPSEQLGGTVKGACPYVQDSSAEGGYRPATVSEAQSGQGIFYRQAQKGVSTSSGGQSFTLQSESGTKAGSYVPQTHISTNGAQNMFKHNGGAFTIQSGVTSDKSGKNFNSMTYYPTSQYKLGGNGSLNVKTVNVNGVSCYQIPTTSNAQGKVMFNKNLGVTVTPIQKQPQAFAKGVRIRSAGPSARGASARRGVSTRVSRQEMEASSK